MGAGVVVKQNKQDLALVTDPVFAQSGTRKVFFYFEPEFSVAGRSGPAVVVLVGPRWNAYLRKRIGVVCAPFFERDPQAHEPDTHANGQPFAWVYSSPGDAVKDEGRWLSALELGLFAEALNKVQQAAATVPLALGSGAVGSLLPEQVIS